MCALHQILNDLAKKTNLDCILGCTLHCARLDRNQVNFFSFLTHLTLIYSATFNNQSITSSTLPTTHMVYEPTNLSLCDDLFVTRNCAILQFATDGGRKDRCQHLNSICNLYFHSLHFHSAHDIHSA